MQDHVYKVAEIVGSSRKSTDDAVHNAVTKASETISHLRWLEVIQTRAHLEDNKIDHWQVVVKIGFTLED